MIKISNLEHQLNQLLELEKLLEDKRLEFEKYSNTPEQKDLYRSVTSGYESLKIFHNTIKQLKEVYNKIVGLENRNKILFSELEVIEQNLSLEHIFREIESSFEVFKAKIDQIKYERTEKRNLEHKRIQIRKQCPEETPEHLPDIKSFQSTYEPLQKNFIKFLQNKPRNILILIVLFLLTLVPLIFGGYVFTIIGSCLLGGFILILLHQFNSTRKIYKNLENLIFNRQTSLEIDVRIKETVDNLNSIYINIQQTLTPLPPFYTAIFEIKENLDDREIVLRVFFQTLNEKINELKITKGKKIKEIDENNLTIDQKPIVTTDISKNEYNIKNVQEEIESFIGDLKPKYILENIDVLYHEEVINFDSIEITLNKMKSLIKKDMDIFDSLTTIIDNLEKKLEIKSKVEDDLKSQKGSKAQYFTNLISFNQQLSSRYSHFFGDEEEIKLKINDITLFEPSFSQLSQQIKQDQNKVHQLEAKRQTNNEVIKNKPEVINAITQIQEIISKIIKKLIKIIFPEIPEHIKDKFNYKDPQKCILILENILKEHREEKNTLEGERNNINDNRIIIREYLTSNIFIISDFFTKKSDITVCEWDLKVLTKSIEIIDNVNRKIWDRQLPFIESYIREFLPKITLGRYRTMKIKSPESQRKKKYEFKVLEETTQSFIDKELLSGGTEDQILLVIRVAFAVSLLPQSKGTYPKFLFLDESFASSDKYRRLEILNWLKKDLSSTFSQIIIISHQQEIIERIPYYYSLNRGRIEKKVIPFQ